MHEAEPALGAHAISGFSGPKTDCGERRFNRIRGADVLEVRGREVVEGQQLDPILDQAIDGPGVFVLVGGDETIDRQPGRLQA